MERKTLDVLESIVGEKNVSLGSEAKRKFLRPGQKAPHLVAVSPSDDGEVQKIVDLVREQRIAIVTVNDRRVVASSAFPGAPSRPAPSSARCP